jgi:hypothetical protein
MEVILFFSLTTTCVIYFLCHAIIANDVFTIIVLSLALLLSVINIFLSIRGYIKTRR